MCQGVASLYYIYVSKNVSNQHLVRRLLLHFITIIVAALTILDGLESNWLVNDVTKERIVTRGKGETRRRKITNRPIARNYYYTAANTKACVYLETACPTERAGHLAKGENLIPVNCHANVIRVHNVYIIHRVS